MSVVRRLAPLPLALMSAAEVLPRKVLIPVLLTVPCTSLRVAAPRPITHLTSSAPLRILHAPRDMIHVYNIAPASHRRAQSANHSRAVFDKGCITDHRSLINFDLALKIKAQVGKTQVESSFRASLESCKTNAWRISAAERHVRHLVHVAIGGYCGTTSKHYKVPRDKEAGIYILPASVSLYRRDRPQRRFELSKLSASHNRRCSR